MNKKYQVSAEQRRNLIREERYKEMEKFIDKDIDKYDQESQDDDVSCFVEQDSIVLNKREKSCITRSQIYINKNVRQSSELNQRQQDKQKGYKNSKAPSNLKESLQKNTNRKQEIQSRIKQPFQTKTTFKKQLKKQIIFNAFFTIYPVIGLAAKNIGFKTIFKDHFLVPSPQLKAQYRIAPGIYANIPTEEFDVVWFDCPTRDDVFTKIKMYQRISQVPGIQVLSSKARLARNLNLMLKQFPNEYNFFPKTFLLPQEIQDFKKAVMNQSINKDVFIVKPSHQCQGRGIHLVKQWEDYQEESNQNNGQVAQVYLDDPLLIDGLKFDLRIYVLIFGVHPLRIYIYDDGLARFATTSYESVLTGDIKNLFIHLTNYSINKNSEHYVQNENFDGGTGTTQDNQPNFQKLQEGETGGEGDYNQNKKLPHKRSLKQIFNQIQQKMGQSAQNLKQDINDLIIKTIITGQPHLYQTYKNLMPEDVENQMCFQILGFDVMIDSKLKPWLIEINQSPSFATDSAFDFKLKKKLMEDTFRLLNLNLERKSQYFEKIQSSQFDRLMSHSKKQKLNFQEKEFERYQNDFLRDKQEQPLLEKGGYTQIFPVKNNEGIMQQYVQFIKISKELQDFFINGKKIKQREESVYDMLLKSQLTKKLERQQSTFQQKNNSQLLKQVEQLQKNFSVQKFIDLKIVKNQSNGNAEILKKEQVKFYQPKFEKIESQNIEQKMNIEIQIEKLEQNQQQDQLFLTKNLGKQVFGKKNEENASEREKLVKNESQKNIAKADSNKIMGAIFNIFGTQQDLLKNPYIISKKNQEIYNQRYNELMQKEMAQKIGQEKVPLKKEIQFQSPKQNYRPISSNQTEIHKKLRNIDYINQTPNPAPNKFMQTNNYQRVLYNNRFTLNQQPSQILQAVQLKKQVQQRNQQQKNTNDSKNTKKETEQSLESESIQNEQKKQKFLNNYIQKRNSYKKIRENNKINADISSAIHSVDFANKRGNEQIKPKQQIVYQLENNYQKSDYIDQSISKNLKESKSQFDYQELQNYKGLFDKEDKINLTSHFKILRDQKQSIQYSPSFLNEDQPKNISKSPFISSKTKNFNKEQKINLQIYQGYQIELERLQKIEKVLKQDAIQKKQENMLEQSQESNQDNQSYQFKTPQRIKKLQQNVEKIVTDEFNAIKENQKIFQTANKLQVNNEQNILQMSSMSPTSNLVKQQKKIASFDKKKSLNDEQDSNSQQHTKKYLNNQNSQSLLKTNYQKQDFQQANNKFKKQEIYNVKIQIVETSRKNREAQNDYQQQKKTMTSRQQQEESRKIFKQFIESQKQKGCDPVFDLKKDFKQLKVIGSGTFSNVSQMTHIETGQQVAIKTFEKTLFRRKSQLMAIHREIYILAKMDHPNIMKLYEVLDTTTHVSLVLQLCNGIKLNDYVQKYGTKGRIGINNNVTSYLSEAKSKLIFRQLVDAVSYMHTHGIVHRDLRIETVIINESSTKIKLVDFGFATSFESYSQFQNQQSESHEDLQSTFSKNTEILKNRTLTCQLQDCYNLGVILFILLTGGLPIWAHIESDIYQKIISPKNSLPLSQTDNRGFDTFSKECQDLINKLFICDLQNQITLQEVLSCEWLNLNKT